jgi:anhydro-N-acetylmuramic acid kinase
VLHRPEARLTVQLGDGALLARLTGCQVVSDLRAADVAAGGQGAPLAPVYHRALAMRLPQRPVVLVNIGGVANVTWIGGNGELLAFDTGPGNALMDDWALRHTGRACDENGELARSGVADEAALRRYLAHPFFAQPVPKSLDRGSISRWSR